jgi:hypothetical protein
MSRSTTTVIFTMCFVAWAVGAMAVSIYGFDQYERAWGPGPSYQVVLWIILVAAVLIAVGFALGAKQLAFVPWWRPLLLSAIFTPVFGALTYLAGYLGRLGVEQNLRLILLGLLSFISAFLAAKLLARHALPANPPLNTDAPPSGGAPVS